MGMADTAMEDAIIAYDDLKNIIGDSANLHSSGVLGDIHAKSGFTNK